MRMRRVQYAATVSGEAIDPKREGSREEPKYGSFRTTVLNPVFRRRRQQRPQDRNEA
jgi:hypothetical protein